MRTPTSKSVKKEAKGKTTHERASILETHIGFYLKGPNGGGFQPSWMGRGSGWRGVVRISLCWFRVGLGLVQGSLRGVKKLR